MWPWCKINDEELDAVAGGYTVDIPGLEAIGPCAVGGVIICSENNDLPTPKPIT